MLFPSSRVCISTFDLPPVHTSASTFQNGKPKVRKTRNTFDAENRVTKVDTTAATYTYNPLGNRVRKDVGSASTEYFYSGSIIIAELNVSTTAWTNYTYFNGQRVARRDPTGSVFYYFTDLVHSSSVVSDSSGTIKSESDFYPWGGELQIVNNDPGNHYKFTGKERDSESQLDYFGARYYANLMGRFITPDWTANRSPFRMRSSAIPRA